jgi:hypothetical protein
MTMSSKKNLAKAPAPQAAGASALPIFGRVQRVDFARALSGSIGRRMPDYVLPDQMLTMKSRRPSP